jgi:hypothetical protein
MSFNVCLQDSFPLTVESAATKAKLVPRIEAHNAECDRLAEDERELSAAANEDWTEAHRTAARKIRARKVELLRQEIELRREIEAHLDRVVSVDFGAAQTAANTDFEATKSDVTSKLEAIGYVAPNFGIVGVNPRVKAARMALDSIGTTSVRESRIRNAKELKQADATLAELRKSDLAVA